MIETGLEIFLKKEHKKYRSLRLGVLCHPASVNRQLQHVSQLILDKKLGLNVTCFLGPQHGIRGEKQDNMIESEDFIDPITKLPVFSLYASTREPTPTMLSRLDAFVVDLQDIGGRIYTFMYTMAYCMRAAKADNKKVIVLDRPNPIGGLQTEGNVLENNCASFVGLYPMCARHGMTMGELALMFNEAFGIHCDLEVIPVKGWKRSQYAETWNRDWIPPSPNIPVVASALTFPGMVLFEGTNVSEGRGTTKPFEWIGAPFIDPDRLAHQMNELKMKGVYFRPIFFQPTFHKGKDQVCGGVNVHVTDRKQFNAFRAGIHLVNAIATMYPREFRWKEPPYEYEYERKPIDLIAGTTKFREAVEKGKGLRDFEASTQEQLAKFRKLRNRFLLYK